MITVESRSAYPIYQRMPFEELKSMITYASDEKNLHNKTLLLNAIYRRFCVIPEVLRDQEVRKEFSRLIIIYAKTIDYKKSIPLFEFALCQLINLLDLGTLCPDWPNQTTLEELATHLDNNRAYSMYWNQLPLTPDCLGFYAQDKGMSYLINTALILLKRAYSRLDILDEKNDEIVMRLRYMIEATKAKL